jgi:hypothetical protein
MVPMGDFRCARRVKSVNPSLHDAVRMGNAFVLAQMF